jgi:dTMP kinase
MTVLENFIVLEGLDGSGTTTQLELLRSRLGCLRKPHHCTSEPTEGPVGRLIRSALKGSVVLDHGTIAYLFAADRHEHLFAPEAGIVARAKRGEVVVSDRYIFSSLAYQGLLCGIDLVRQLNDRFPLPAHVIFLDTPVDVSQSRISGRVGREIFDDQALQSKVRDLYFEAFAAYRATPLGVHVLDGAGPVDQVAEEVWNVVRRLPIMGA